MEDSADGNYFGIRMGGAMMHEKIDDLTT